MLLLLARAREASGLGLHWLLSRKASSLRLELTSHLRHSSVLRLHLIRLTEASRLGTKAARLQVRLLLSILLLPRSAAVAAS